MLPCVDRPDPSSFAYHSDVLLRDEDGTPAIWHISIPEYVVIALLLSQAGAPDCAVGVT